MRILSTDIALSYIIDSKVRALDMDEPLGANLPRSLGSRLQPECMGCFAKQSERDKFPKWE